MRYDDVESQKRAIVEYWIGTAFNASWSALAGALYQMNEETALSKCRKYLNVDQGK